MPRAAVIANPIKITDTLRPALTEAMASRGWDDPLWLETSADDTGHAMTKEALTAGVDRVIAAGGDGTVRVVAGELAQSGVPLALIPSGTGNLLARNLGIPLQETPAIETALSDAKTTISLIKVVADGGDPQWSAVMTGMGFDAMIMDHTDPRLKSTVGPGAYIIAAAQQVGQLPVRLEVQVDEERAFTRYAILCVIGNVGQLIGGLDLMPEADPTDDTLNVLVVSPHRKRDFVRVVVRVLLRRRRPDKSLDRVSGRQVRIQVPDGDTYQIDGDVAGRCHDFRAEVVPDALILVAAGAELRPTM
ncbi:MAG: diacylglycerol/lipid kinase family protein [Propionibacteriaceae bacterium]